ARFTGEIDDAELLCWRYEEVIREAAWAELELWVYLRKTRSKSSSSRNRALLTSVLGLLRVTSSTSSSAHPRAFGYNSARVIIRPNLHHRARLNMRLKKTISTRPTYVTATRPTFETATTQESRVATDEAQSFTYETPTTGTGTRDIPTLTREQVPKKTKSTSRSHVRSTTSTAESTILTFKCPDRSSNQSSTTRRSHSRLKSTTSTGENTMVPREHEEKLDKAAARRSRAKSTTSTTENTMAARIDEAENPPPTPDGSPDRTEW
ncbi:unnamed protein product, partial [Mesorhabditis spiculigera]